MKNPSWVFLAGHSKLEPIVGFSSMYGSSTRTIPDPPGFTQRELSVVLIGHHVLFENLPSSEYIFFIRRTHVGFYGVFSLFRSWLFFNILILFTKIIQQKSLFLTKFICTLITRLAFSTFRKIFLKGDFDLSNKKFKELYANIASSLSIV